MNKNQTSKSCGFWKQDGKVILFCLFFFCIVVSRHFLSCCWSVLSCYYVCVCVRLLFFFSVCVFTFFTFSRQENLSTGKFEIRRRVQKLTMRHSPARGMKIELQLRALKLINVFLEVKYWIWKRNRRRDRNWRLELITILLIWQW